MYKPRLFAPGPTVVPPETLLELARPVTHHRTAEFRDTFKQVTELLQYVFQTKRPVYTMTGSGSLAMEASVANVVAPGGIRSARNFWSASACRARSSSWSWRFFCQSWNESS